MRREEEEQNGRGGGKKCIIIISAGIVAKTKSSIWVFFGSEEIVIRLFVIIQ
jgi:hypothetical protein